MRTHEMTIQWVLQSYPNRIRALFDALDLDRIGLEAVKEAVGRGDRATACRALLDYYRMGGGTWSNSTSNSPCLDAGDPASDYALASEAWVVAYAFDHIRSANPGKGRPGGAPIWAAEFQGGPISTGFHKRNQAALAGADRPGAAGACAGARAVAVCASAIVIMAIGRQAGKPAATGFGRFWAVGAGFQARPSSARP